MSDRDPRDADDWLARFTAPQDEPGEGDAEGQAQPIPAPVPPPAPAVSHEPEPLVEPAPTEAFPAPTVPMDSTIFGQLDAHPADPHPPAVDDTLAGAEAPTELLGHVGPGPSGYAPSDIPRSGDALDALFGQEKFREYTEPSPENPFAAKPVSLDDPEEAPAELSRPHRILLWSAGGAVALLALIALFVLGTRLPVLLGWDTTGNAATPDNPVISTEGPVDPGIYNWEELLGGECLEPFGGAWENEYTVVDCGEPHTAQLVVRGQVPVLEGSGGAYPGSADLQTRMNLLCTDGTVLDYEAAEAFSDLQFEASFPATEEAWNEGRRDYFCFVSLASGEPLGVNLAADPRAGA